MADRFLVSAVGAIIEVDVSARDVLFQRRARGAWADALYAGDRHADAVAVVREGLDDDAALSWLSTEVTIAALAHRRSDPVWMLHAAGLADEAGRVVVLSAPSGTGKTTAARHLSQRLSYVSDETVGIDVTGRVVPYRKPLSIIREHSAHKDQLALSSINGVRPLAEDLRVAKIVVIERSPDGPEEPRLDELDLSEALELLGPQTSYLSEGEAPLQLIAAILDATGGAVRIRYRDVTHIDDLIDSLLRTEARPIEPRAARPREQAVASTSAGAVVRAAVVDELERDGRTVLLRRTPLGGQVHVLDGIGPALWAAADGRSLDGLVEAVVAAHGAPEGADARTLVDAAVQELVADGLLLTAAPQT
ncbi:PqqD family peptide modification chaperone [Microbacterium sp. PMB16]|uniref:ATP-binding protein n=1 Tax=Microbacterium sp. PMB16 TaxID=3120157 RepID=UPI003F4B6C7E